MTLRIDRRTLLAGGAALIASPGFAASGSASRVFSVWRDGSDIGRHRLEARLTPDGFQIDIDVDIAVKLFGFTAYRYTLTNREVWRGQRIVSVSSRANDDGDKGSVEIRRTDSALEIDASGYSGSEPLEAVTTSYYAPAFLERRPWISTQSGKPLEIEARRKSAGRWSVTGDVNVRLSYEDGEWVGSEFTTEGERITYQTLESTGDIAALWQQA